MDFYYKNTIQKWLKTIISLSVLPFISCEENRPKITEYSGYAQGSTYYIKFVSDSGVQNLHPAIDSILEVIDLSMSAYRPESLISKINAGEDVQVDAHFEKVIKASRQIWEESGGLFDPTVGVLVNAWGFGKDKSHNVLTNNQIDSLLTMVGFGKITFTDDRRIVKENKNIVFDFNAIAQGYTVDVIADFLKSKGITNFIVEVGGEMYLGGRNTLTDKAWTIGIDDPLQSPDERELIRTVRFSDKGLATSGNYRKVWTDSLTGERFVHSINPITGEAKQNNMLSATVIAESSMLADGYATMLMIMGKEEAVRFLEQHPELDVMLIYNDMHNNTAFYETKGFKKYTE
ncbi:MAG: FAD:protein FMN transferase [Capnocytophaga sp.]|nr:FAD:protein FMN transferase [Capnocytophaga sp.]